MQAIHRLATSFVIAVLAVTVDAQISNQDDCANSGLDVLGPGSWPYDTTGASTGVEGQLENCAPSGSIGCTSDIWFTYTATITGVATLETCNSGGHPDSRLTVWPATGPCPVDGTSIECNDDACPGFLSSVTISVVAGTDYIVQLGDWPGTAGGGTGVLDITESSLQLSNQDDCANAGLDVVGAGMYAYDTTAASTGTEGQMEDCTPSVPFGCTSDIWFTYTASVNGSATIANCGASHDSRIAVYPAAGCPANGSALTCNDDTCGLSSTVCFPVIAGADYIVQLGDWPGTSGGGTGVVEIIESTTPPAPIELRAHFKLDETSGAGVTDASGNGNTGTFIGGFGLGQPGAAPTTGTSVDFNGVHMNSAGLFDAHAVIPGSVSLDDLINDLTVAAWVNINQFPPDSPPSGPPPIPGNGIARIFGHAGPFSGWSFAIRNTDLDGNGTSDPGFRFSAHPIVDYDLAAPVTEGVWHHVAAVVDQCPNVTFYLDGVPVGTLAGNEQPVTPSGQYFIGAWTVPTFGCGGGTIDCAEFFNGRIDELQVYQGQLTGSDVAFLFNNPGATIGSDPPVGTNYCVSISTSSGNPATISATGSVSVVDATLSLRATGLPSGVSGIFYYGLTQITVPFGDGFRCVGGATQRLPFNSANAGGDMTEDDVFSLPMSNLPITPGTLNFQAWFRDPPAMNTGFNLSNGLSVTFVP